MSKSRTRKGENMETTERMKQFVNVEKKQTNEYPMGERERGFPERDNIIKRNQRSLFEKGIYTLF